ncbi:MAG: hypothetical protein LBI48_09290 [Burkholderiaceae bacterium]|jgi:hypothetical protein|nr:hypothetical protein [Burkholderiaceae bacterium]
MVRVEDTGIIPVNHFGIKGAGFKSLIHRWSNAGGLALLSEYFCQLREGLPPHELHRLREQRLPCIYGVFHFWKTILYLYA